MVKHTANSIDKRLKDSLENFKGEFQFIMDTLQEKESGHVTQYDLERTTKHIIYTLMDFNLAFVDYIEQEEKRRQP